MLAGDLVESPATHQADEGGRAERFSHRQGGIFEQAGHLRGAGKLRTPRENAHGLIHFEHELPRTRQLQLSVLPNRSRRRE